MLYVSILQVAAIYWGWGNVRINLIPKWYVGIDWYQDKLESGMELTIFVLFVLMQHKC